MTKTSKVMLVFACIFVTLAFSLVAFQAYVELCSMGILFKGETTFGDAIGGIFHLHLQHSTWYRCHCCRRCLVAI